MRTTITLVAVGLAGLLSACGSDSGSAQTAQTVTVVEKTVTEQAPSTQAEPSADTKTTATTKTQESDNGSTSSGKIKVPDVEGIDHQLAQDTMQAAGLYNLAEEDATGQGRMLLIDRNWTVVSQSPAAGSMVSEDQTITLRSKKDDE
jgi:beta-lactam-binding protein with PASTA domain